MLDRHEQNIWFLQVENKLGKRIEQTITASTSNISTNPIIIVLHLTSTLTTPIHEIQLHALESTHRQLSINGAVLLAGAQPQHLPSQNKS